MSNQQLSTAVQTLEFDLYLDESGDFVSKDEIWLIGGHLLPHKDDNSDMISRWWKEVLRSVDARYPSRETDYALAHCMDSRNRLHGKTPRSRIQPMVLEILLNRIHEAGGAPVIFASPVGSCHRNGEMNYVALLCKGYTQLLSRLQEMYPGASVRIYPKPSRRKETEGRFLFLLNNDEQIRRQYIAFMVNTALGLGNPDVLVESINKMEIITDQMKPRVAINGDFEEDYNGKDMVYYNLNNVIADYICNSYYNLGKENYSDLLKHALIFAISRDGQPVSASAAVPAPANASAEKTPVEPEKTIEDCREFLLGKGGISSFNEMSEAKQREIAARLFAELRPLVMRQEQLDVVNRDIDKLMDAMDDVDLDSVRATLKANLLLFKLGILNHWGQIDQADALSDSFFSALDGISTNAESNALRCQFYNRRIVLHTDHFDYAAAEEDFLTIHAHWDNYLTNFGKETTASGRVPDFSGLSCAEYSYTINSVLQNSRHRIRISSGVERSGIYLNALSRSYTARLHIQADYDLARLEQTMSNIESEMGNFTPAFNHLLSAARLTGGDAWAEKYADALASDDNAITAGRCGAILGVVGKRDAKNKPQMEEPFILFHYLRLADEMCIAGDPRFEILRDELFKHSGALEPKSYDCIRVIHARTQILWKLGSIAAHSGKTKEAGRLMNAAFNQLNDVGASVFLAIAIAVGAEHVALNLSGSAEKAEELRKLYSRFTMEKSLFMRDPFAACGAHKALTGSEYTPEDMMKISRVIAY